MNPFPSSKQLKQRTRQRMVGALGPCLMAATALVVAQLLLTGLLQSMGGTFLLYFWDTATNDIPSSLSLSSAGLFTALRVDEMGMGVSLAITPTMVLTVLGAQLLCAAVIAPLRLGSTGQLWAVHRGAPLPTRSLLAPYADPRRSVQSILLEVLLTLIQLLLQLVCSIPALYVLKTRGPSLEGFSAAGWTFLLGLAICWTILTQFGLARFLLARDSSATALGALRDNFALMRGAGGRFLRFRLSFVFLELLSAMTNGVFDAFRFPYQGLTTIQWLEQRELEQKEDKLCPL